MTTRQLTFAILWSCILLGLAFGYLLSGASLPGMKKRYVHERHCIALRSLCYYEKRDLWLSDALDKAQARGSRD